MARPKNALPAGLTPRGLTIGQAAAVAGLSEGAFATARARGQYPNPTLPGGRIDLVLLQHAMDRLSGLTVASEVVDSLAAWEASRSARRA